MVALDTETDKIGALRQDMKKPDAGLVLDKKQLEKAIQKKLSPDAGKLMTQRFIFKLKDKAGRQTQRIFNSQGPYLVVKNLWIKKIAGVNNHIEVVLEMPNPETIEINELSEAPNKEVKKP